MSEKITRLFPHLPFCLATGAAAGSDTSPAYGYPAERNRGIPEGERQIDRRREHDPMKSEFQIPREVLRPEVNAATRG